MTAPVFVSNDDSIASNDDLPRPESMLAATRFSVPPRPLSGVADTGRISFGAACRLPNQK